ncbi:hypothetical protein D3C72_2302990 [compost metagenome]
MLINSVFRLTLNRDGRRCEINRHRKRLFGLLVAVQINAPVGHGVIALIAQHQMRAAHNFSAINLVVGLVNSRVFIRRGKCYFYR